MENNTTQETDLAMDLEYIISKRDDALEHFIGKLKSHELTDEQLHIRLDTVLKFNRQVKLMEDIIVTYKIIRENNPYQNSHIE